MRLNLLHKKGFEYLRISRKMSKLSAVSLVMIRYNILALIKRTLDYNSKGGLFGDMYLGVPELTMVEKIWAIEPSMTNLRMLHNLYIQDIVACSIS